MATTKQSKRAAGKDATAPPSHEGRSARASELEEWALEDFDFDFDEDFEEEDESL